MGFDLKTPPIRDEQVRWEREPFDLSERCLEWLAKFRDGWRPNRRISGMGYDSRAEFYGVRIWESSRVLGPALETYQRIDEATREEPLDDELRPELDRILKEFLGMRPRADARIVDKSQGLWIGDSVIVGLTAAMIRASLEGRSRIVLERPGPTDYPVGPSVWTAYPLPGPDRPTTEKD